MLRAMGGRNWLIPEVSSKKVFAIVPPGSHAPLRTPCLGAYGLAVNSVASSALRRGIGEERFRDHSFSGAAQLVVRAPLTHRVPRCHVLQFRHDLDQLLFEHRRHPF